MRRSMLLATLLTLAIPAAAQAKVDHSLWPKIDMILSNFQDGDRPLDARPGMDPFDGTDPKYECKEGSSGTGCYAFFTESPDGSGGKVVKPDARIHSELLGGHGDDVIHAGDLGDVIWGDFKPKDNPASQTDALYGGAGVDHIYVSHGRNTVVAGGGDDRIHAHYGKGTIDCGAGKDIVFVSHATVKLYKRTGCEKVSYMLNAP